jgi:hypothetical protein
MVVEKRAVCWLDVFIFVIFVTAGLWLWSVADRFVSEERRELKPVIEAYEHQANVPFLQVGFTMAQEELKMLQNRLFELRMEATRLAADLDLRVGNPRAKLLSPQHEQRIKLLTTQTMVRAYEAEVPEKAQQVARAATVTFQAKRSAEFAYHKATKEFEFENKMWVLPIGFACWTILALSTWLLCGTLRKHLGHGSTSHVLLPGSVLMALACIYYVVR